MAALRKGIQGVPLQRMHLFWRDRVPALQPQEECHGVERRGLALAHIGIGVSPKRIRESLKPIGVFAKPVGAGQNLSASP